MKTARVLLIIAAVASVAVIAAVSWHSVEEIHYMKTFYPSRFTVEEANLAAWVELIKVHLISLPLVIITAAAVYLLKSGRS